MPGPLSFNAHTTRRSIHPRVPHDSPNPAAKTADRLVAARAWKSPWLVTVLEAYDGRLAIEATMEPPVTVSRNQRSKIPDEWRASIGLRGDAGRGAPDIDRREEKRIKRYRRDRTGSALAPMEVGIRAELGSAEMLMFVRSAPSSGRRRRGDGWWSERLKTRVGLPRHPDRASNSLPVSSHASPGCGRHEGSCFRRGVSCLQRTPESRRLQPAEHQRCATSIKEDPRPVSVDSLDGRHHTAIDQ